MHFVDQQLLLGSGAFAICKDVADPFTHKVNPFSSSYNGTIITFTVDGIAYPITVAAGACPLPMFVPLTRDGTTTVTEQPLYGFMVDSVTAAAAGNSVPVTLSGLYQNAATFTVVPTANETQVTFNNRPLTAQIKICKSITPG